MKHRLAFIIHILLIAAGAIGMIMVLDRGPRMLYYYTIDSNLLAIIGSVIYLAGEAAARRDLWGRRPQMPQVFRYITLCCLMVTFIVVMTVLLPIYMMSGYGTAGMFSGWNLFFHVIAPLLSLFSFWFLEDHEDLPGWSTFAAVIPTVIYAVVLIIMNIKGYVEGPYPFLMVRRQSAAASVLWCAAILAGNLLLALIIGASARALSRRARLRRLEREKEDLNELAEIDS